MHRTRHARRFVTVLLALVVIAAGMLEVALRRASRQAGRELGPALRLLPTPAGAPRTADLGARHAATALAPFLETVASTAPSPEAHRATALAWHAAGDALRAARHAELAWRLDPTNAALGSLRERTLNASVLARLSRQARPFVLGGALVLVVLLLRRGRRRRHARRRRRWLDGLSADVHVVADGRRLAHGEPLPATDDVAIDVFLRGRHGLARPPCDPRGARLGLVLSHAGASRTLRLTPVDGIRQDAIRVPLKDSTLDALRAEPGAWRLHVQLDDRGLVIVPLQVGTPAARRHRQPA